MNVPRFLALGTLALGLTTCPSEQTSLEVRHDLGTVFTGNEGEDEVPCEGESEDIEDLSGEPLEEEPEEGIDQAEESEGEGQSEPEVEVEFNSKPRLWNTVAN